MMGQGPRYPYPQPQQGQYPQQYPPQQYPQYPPQQQYMPPQQMYGPQQPYYGPQQGYPGRPQQQQGSGFGKMACMATLAACCTACLCSCLGGGGGGGDQYSEDAHDDGNEDVHYVTEIIRLPPRSSSAPELHSKAAPSKADEKRQRKIESLSPDLVLKCKEKIESTSKAER